MQEAANNSQLHAKRTNLWHSGHIRYCPWHSDLFFLSFSENLMLGRSWGLWAGNNFEQSGDDRGKENSHYLQQSTASHDPRFPQEQESITESA